MIRGITFDEQLFYSSDYSQMNNFLLGGNDGITKGCTISHDSTSVTIGKGNFVIQGRLFKVESDEVIDSAGFESGYNRIVYEIDLSQENTLTEFNQGSIKILHDNSITQGDLDNGDKVYQFPLCNFQWSGTEMTTFEIEATVLTLSGGGGTTPTPQEGLDILTFSNIEVQRNIFYTDSKYFSQGYGYSAQISLANVTADYIPEVNFGMVDASSGNFAAIAETGFGFVKIYAMSVPDDKITIPSIVCIKKK